MADAVGVARGVAETGLAARRPSAAAPTATRDLNLGDPRIVYPLCGWLGLVVVFAARGPEPPELVSGHGVRWDRRGRCLMRVKARLEEVGKR